MSVRLNPEQAYLGYFENAIERRLPAVYASGGELLSELARKRIEASLWRELSQTTHPGFRHHDRLTLLYGLAGVGYELLRYARPDLVASVI